MLSTMCDAGADYALTDFKLVRWAANLLGYQRYAVEGVAGMGRSIMCRECWLDVRKKCHGRQCLSGIER